MRKIWASYGCLAVTAAVAAVMLATPLAAGSGESERAVKVETATVCLGTVERVLALSGRVRYETEYGALAPSTGLVAEVYVRPGQRVSAGQALFRMDGTAQEAAVTACLARGESISGALPTELTGTAEALQSAAWENLAASQLALEALTVRAQVDGLVQQVNVTAHSGVTAGTLAMALSGEQQQVVASAALRDAEKLQPGQRARILVQGVEQAQATVESIGAAATDASTGQVTCQVTLALDQRLELPLGAQVEAEVELLRAENVTVVPLQALSQEGSVWWIADGRAWETDAAVVAQDEVSAWVALPEGTSVVVSSARELSPGQRIKEMTP